MDPISIVVVLLVFGGLAWLVWPSKGSDTEADVISVYTTKPAESVVTPEPEVAEPEVADQVTPPTRQATVSPRVWALKSPDAVPAEAAPAARKPPTKTDLVNMTKAQIEETARLFDIELDRRLTKTGMITAFQSELKAQAKAARKNS